MCNFYIGQKVVYVGPDRGFDPNPGKTIHTIKAIRKSCCGMQLDVGRRTDKFDLFQCDSCGRTEPHVGIRWKKIESFRPLIEDYTEEEIEAVNIDELVEPEYEYA